MKKSKMVELALSVVPKSEQAEAQGEDGGDVLLLTYQEIERFAALVAEKEREECAKVCDEATELLNRLKNHVGADETNACAVVIRARGNK